MQTYKYMYTLLSYSIVLLQCLMELCLSSVKVNASILCSFVITEIHMQQCLVLHHLFGTTAYVQIVTYVVCNIQLMEVGYLRPCKYLTLTSISQLSPSHGLHWF